MRINRENYEEFLVDYAEGTLSAELVQQVESFLLLNPDVQEEFDLYNESMLETADVLFSKKEDLKKIPFEKTSFSSEYFQQLCVAKVEGLLPANDADFLNKMVASDKQKKHELELFEKTKLIVEQFNYNEKLTLKQDEIIHNVGDANFEEYCIACMEGWLDQKGLVSLNDFIAANPSKKTILDSYFKTKLTPDLSVVFPNKRKIKRFSIFSPKIKKYASIISSAAAIVVMAFMFFYTTTLDDKSKIASSVISNKIPVTEIFKMENTELELNSDANKAKEQKRSILHDPFGFEKISGNINEKMRVGSMDNRVLVNAIQRIEIDEVDCPPCKQAFSNKTLADFVYIKPFEIDEQRENVSNQKNKLKTEPV